MTNLSYQPLDFMKYRSFYFLLSACVILPGLISLFRFGLKPAIDFTGGSLIEIKTSSPLNSTQVSQSLPFGVELASLQPTDNQSLIIRTSPMSKDQNETFLTQLASVSAQATTSAFTITSPPPLDTIRFETVGPTLGAELLKKTLVAVALASIVITLYVASSFSEISYGLTAILAMFHDTLVILGIFSLLGHYFGVEVDTLFVTALLTILSFSVHDTIVVYDRIRESRKRLPHLPFVQLVNKAVTETLTRSINNSMTIIFMLLALYLLGGESTKWFVFALLIGTISGTYSSTFTAAPLLTVWMQIAHRRPRR